jgi:outer membrane autotransporter protein
MIDIKNLMNGPAQLMWTETFTLPAGATAVFSNNITDAWLRYEQKTQDPADEAAWQAEIAAKGWKDGLPATATAVDQSEYTYQTARAADRAARANDHGDLIKSGGGALTLTGTNTYSGATEIREGLLNLDGVNKNSRTIVNAGGTLGGGGSGHGLWAKTGGIVAPGHSIGALHFDDAGIQLDAGSIYHAELGQSGAADLLATTGAASIDAAKLLATTEGSSSALTYAELNQLLNGHESQSFLLLTADKGVSGAFDTSLMQVSDSFQHLQLNYSTTSVSLLAFQNSGAIRQDGIWPRSAGQITQDEIWPREVGAITNDPTAWINTTPAAAATEPPTPSAEPEPAMPPADNAVVPDVAAPVVEPSPPSKPAIVDVVIERGARFTPSTGDGGLPEPVITSGKGQIGGSHLSLPAKMIKTLTKLAPNKGMFQAYEILTAQQGLEGTFDANDLPQFAFFNLSLTYSENTVTLDVLHRDIGFADIAATPNQAAVAAAADRLKPDNIVHDTILYVPTVQEARLDYQYMTGEVHGDVAGEVLDDSHIIRDAVLERMAKRAPDTSAFWLKTIGSFGSTASDHNAVKVNRQTDGLMAGADMVLGDSWIVGAAANYEGTPLHTAGMGIASITSYHLAGYGGGDLLGLSLHIGGTYGHYDAKTTRVVGVPDLAGIEQARYGANQSQAFGEIGFPLAFEDTAIEPFAGISYTDASMEGFAETGGPASLTARAQSLDRTQSTLGARLSVTYRDNETVFTPNLELAWDGDGFRRRAGRERVHGHRHVGRS